MKPFVAILCTFFLCASASGQQVKKQSNTDIMDLVVEIPQLDLNKSFRHLKKYLDKVESVRVEGFCNSMKILCLRFQPDQYFNVLVAINEAGFTYYVKSNTDVNAAINACSDKSGLYIREGASTDNIQ